MELPSRGLHPDPTNGDISETPHNSHSRTAISRPEALHTIFCGMVLCTLRSFSSKPCFGPPLLIVPLDPFPFDCLFKLGLALHPCAPWTFTCSPLDIRSFPNRFELLCANSQGHIVRSNHNLGGRQSVSFRLSPCSKLLASLGLPPTQTKLDGERFRT